MGICEKSLVTISEKAESRKHETCAEDFQTAVIDQEIESSHVTFGIKLFFMHDAKLLIVAGSLVWGSPRLSSGTESLRGEFLAQGGVVWSSR